MRTYKNNVALSTVLLIIVISLCCVSCTKEEKATMSTPSTTPNVSGNPDVSKVPETPGIEVSWEVVENSFENRQAFKSQFTITNNRSVPLDNSNWTYYFNFSRVVEPPAANIIKSVRIIQINGDFFHLPAQSLAMPLYNDSG